MTFVTGITARDKTEARLGRGYTAANIAHTKVLSTDPSCAVVRKHEGQKDEIVRKFGSWDALVQGLPQLAKELGR